ncbi:MAG: hypothetical protein Q8R55_02130 [Candidatus Taylorbacteria bacterium]|nr:hypothetical protein [Candidatus Taylorbacteria bacterium]
MHRDIELIYQNTSGVGTAEFEAGKEAMKDYIKFMWDVARADDYGEPESSMNLPLDDGFKDFLVKKIQEKRNKELKHIIVVGIGGSNMGTMALCRALEGRLGVFLKANAPKIVFVDTVSPPLMAQVTDFLNNQVKSPEEILVNVISKSGETTETIANFEVIYQALKNRFGEKVNERLVFTTDKGSKLWNEAESRKLDLLEVPKEVGGRYSALSAVGLFPLGLADFNIQGFWDGAGEMTKRCLSEDVYQNPALISAIITYFNYRKGFNIYNSFYFNPELKSLGKWYTQLMAESIAKEFNLNGEKINVGITPIVSIGSTDLHSMATLFLGEPRNKFTQFVHASQKENSPVVPKELFLPGLVPDIAGKSIAEIMNAIYYGVKIAFIKNALPYTELVLHEVSESSLGQYLQLKMCETMYLARLIGVNAFDQPKVEEYKRETREILKKL